MSTYGYQGAVAKNTYGLPSNTGTLVQKPVTPMKSPVSTSAYGGQVAKNTTTYPANVQPVVAAPTKTVTPVQTTASSGAIVNPTTAPAPNATYDYTTDPILQQVQAQSAQTSADAQAAALAQQKQLAIQYGDVDLANSLGDTATAAAAGSNPYSIYGQLAHQQPIDELALDENLNKGNLYYSGARINQQSDLANQYGVTRANDATQEQTALAQIQQTLLAAQLAGRQSVDQASSDAYNRFLQQLLTNPPSTASTDTSTGGSGSGGGGDQQASFDGSAPGAPGIDGYPILDMSNPQESAYNPVGPASFTDQTSASAPGYDPYPVLDLSPSKPPTKPKTTVSSHSGQTAKNSY